MEDNIAKELPDLKGKFLAQKEVLKKYILKRLFETEEYAKALDMLIKEEGYFYNNKTLLHNAAVAAYGITQTGNLNSSNYQLIISIWITAVYQDILFVESLHRTSWDDQYTFTLSESLGRIEEDEVIPENVNYNDPIDGAVSIGEVQKNLLTEFKHLLTNTSLYDKSQLIAFEQFFEQEIDAISTLFSLMLRKSCFHATPFFSHYHQTIINAIAKSLENEFGNPDVDNEAVLELGLKYELQTKRFTDFQSAKSICDILILDIENLKHSNISANCSKMNAERYPKLCNQFILKIRSIFDKQVRDGVEFELMFKVYLTICKTIGDHNLKFIFSNYVNRTVVSRLNDRDSIYTKSQALTVLFTTLAVIDDNSQMNENIQLIINASMGDIVTGADTNLIDVIFRSPFFGRFEEGILQEMENNLQIFMIIGNAVKVDSLIDKLLSKVSSSKRNRVNAINQKKNDLFVEIELMQIIDNVNNRVLSNISAMVQMQALYRNYPNHQRLCENMIIMCDMLIEEEIIRSGRNSRQVKNILDQLILNRSAVLRSSAKVLSEKYSTILNQLDGTNRRLMTTVANQFSGISLNAQGLALKDGLNYYIRLSQ